jgi:membrane-bound acyltransferase YfiQ involved in biofilm formation
MELSMTFTLYLIGFLILIAGIAWGLTVAGVPQVYVMIACVILLGLGLATGAARTRSKDPPA